MSTAFVRRGANLLVTGGLAGVVVWIGARYGLLFSVAFIAWVACVFSGATGSAAAVALFAMLAGAEVQAITTHNCAAFRQGERMGPHHRHTRRFP